MEALMCVKLFSSGKLTAAKKTVVITNSYEPIIEPSDRYGRLTVEGRGKRQP